MGFCTKCGQEIIDGQEHICPNAQPAQPVQPQAPAQQVLVQPVDRTVTVQSTDDTIGVSIDTAQVKDKYDSLKTKLFETGDELKRQDGDLFEKDKKIVPEVIAANDGEIPIKQYNIAKLRTRLTLAKADGKLQITNKRVIFRATGRSILGKVTLHEEFKLSELAGVEFRNRPEPNIGNVLFALIITTIFGGIPFLVAANLSDNGFITFLSIALAILGIGAWIFLAVYFAKIKAVKRYYTPRLMGLALCSGMVIQRAVQFIFHGFFSDNAAVLRIPYGTVGIVASVLLLINMILICFIPNLRLKVMTKGGHCGLELAKEEPVALLSFLFNKEHSDNSGFLEVLPWTDTDAAIKEVGAIIDDIQTLGDAAISKWKVD